MEELEDAAALAAGPAAGREPKRRRGHVACDRLRTALHRACTLALCTLDNHWLFSSTRKIRNYLVVIAGGRIDGEFIGVF